MTFPSNWAGAAETGHALENTTVIQIAIASVNFGFIEPPVSIHPSSISHSRAKELFSLC
jgi:hypothetical protein